MKFGIFGGVRTAGPGAEGYQSGYQAYVDMVVEAERLGYHASFLVEHHFTGSGQVSASLNLLTFLAARTSRIRLGTAVLVLPWHDPVLVAEQAATLDLLSNGRFDFGVGKGYRFAEFAGFRIAIDEAGPRFEEAMAVIRRAWNGEGRFSHRGTYWSYDDIVVEPAPVQRPHPPFWLAAGRPESLEAAARGGFNLLLDQFQTFSVTAERLAVYRRARAAAGLPVDPTGAAVARHLAIARTPGERAAALERRMKAQAVMNAHGTSADGGRRSSMVSDADLLKAAEEGVLLGPPEEIVERLRWLAAEGVGYVLLNTASVDDLRVFADEVMPAFA